MEALLRANVSVRDVTRQGDKYHIYTADATAVVNRIAQLASVNDLKILSINTEQPSLEDVFVNYTGLDAVQLERMELLRAAKIRSGRGG